MGDGGMGRWGDGGMGGWGDGGMGRWGDGEMGRWGDGEMGRWGDGEMGESGRWEESGTRGDGMAGNQLTRYSAAAWFGSVAWVGRRPGLVADTFFHRSGVLPILRGVQPTISRVSPSLPRTQTRSLADGMAGNQSTRYSAAAWFGSVEYQAKVKDIFQNIAIQHSPCAVRDGFA